MWSVVSRGFFFGVWGVVSPWGFAWVRWVLSWGSGDGKISKAGRMVCCATPQGVSTGVLAITEGCPGPWAHMHSPQSW